MSAIATILVVDDDAEMRRLLVDDLHEAGYQVFAAADGGEALECLERSEIDVVVSDVLMPGMKGRDLLAQIRARDAELPVILITGFGSIESAVEAVKAGAFDYIAKPFGAELLLLKIERALRARRLHQELVELRRTATHGSRQIVGESPAMQRALSLLGRAAVADSSVLLVGESGSGKELFARALHAQSPRRAAPFLAVNCSAIPEALLESQLFGHLRGAFTDARDDRRGLFQEAAGGTLLLDEIGDLPLGLQGKLLRVLQEHEVHPLGAPAPIPVQVRVVAATHRDLEALVREGRFRQDLYYRLAVIIVWIPPLRDRTEDLVPLVGHFLEKHGQRLGRVGSTLSSEALAAMAKHTWPGNVRELENVIERALVLGRDHEIGLDDLPESLRARSALELGPRAIRPLAEIEHEYILRALRASGGNKTAAARLLGLDRKTLHRKLAGST